MSCETCKRLQEDLFNAKLTISKQIGIISMLKNQVSSGKITFHFLAEVCDNHFTFDVLAGGVKSYATYILDHIFPGKVCVKHKKVVNYISEGDSMIEEPLPDFIAKVLYSTKVKATSLYEEHKETCVKDFYNENDYSTNELSKRFANMALVRSCNIDFCKDVAAFIIKNL